MNVFGKNCAPLLKVLLSPYDHVIFAKIAQQHVVYKKIYVSFTYCMLASDLFTVSIYVFYYTSTSSVL
jgi:hypothetical protein